MNNKTQPALLGGVVMGVLSALPIVNAGNICCCLWVVAGGVVAAYLLQQNQAAPITAADGALVGLLAGVAGAVIASLLSIPIDLMMAPMMRSLFDSALEVTETMPPALRDAIEQYSQQRESGSLFFIVLQRMVGFFFLLFLGAIFSTLGGLLGAAIFRKPGPPGVIDISPSSDR